MLAPNWILTKYKYIFNAIFLVEIEFVKKKQKLTVMFLHMPNNSFD